MTDENIDRQEVSYFEEHTTSSSNFFDSLAK